MTPLLAIFDAIDRVLACIIKPIVALFGFLIAVMLVVGIVSRSLFNSPVFGLEELILVSVMWLYMLGAVLASRERTHLSADFIQTFIKNQTIVKGCHLIASLISLVMAVMFVCWSYDLAEWAIKKGQSTPVFGLPWYLSQSSLFVAAVLLVFYILRDMLQDLSKPHS